VKCPNCGWDADKEREKKYLAFENFTNKVLKKVMNKLQKETGYGISERRKDGNQKKERSN
jgi:hypothetical protein